MAVEIRFGSKGPPDVRAPPCDAPGPAALVSVAPLVKALAH
jgi:hypothetical protein